MTTGNCVSPSLGACHVPCVQECVQLLLLEIEEEFDAPLMLPCITTTLSLNYVLKESRWACCRSDGLLWEGVRFKGYPLLGRAKPSLPEDKLKSIVARLDCHLSPAMDDQKKQTSRAELSGRRLPQHVDLQACFWWAPRDQKIKKL